MFYTNIQCSLCIEFITQNYCFLLQSYCLNTRIKRIPFLLEWYGGFKPDMILFIKPLCLSLTHLHEEGIEVLLAPPINRMQKQYYSTIASLPTAGVMVASPDCDHPFLCRIALLGSMCNMPAKAAVMKIVQHNGDWMFSVLAERYILTLSRM